MPDTVMPKSTEPRDANGMEPRYDIKEVEGRIYRQWEDSGFFNPDKCVEAGVAHPNAEPFSIVLPPPNVTGTLHMGHAFEDTIQDIMVRYQRMRGKKTLWLPGTDHAPIATQAKVESDIYKKEGKTRYDLGREGLVTRVEKFAKESHDTIVSQVKRLGASLDWSREAYTFDEKRNLAVRSAFKTMHDLGLIYQGHRIVNWDPKMQTTISDDEVEWIEEKVPLYYLKYGPFEIATARPETKFGDKYVVMHPDDARYEEYQNGQKIELEWINGPVTATIIKDPVIDMEFGTGVMTITPWHDMTDFEIAGRHSLSMEQIIDLYGKLLPIAGEFTGQHIKKARPLVVEKLRQKGLVARVENDYMHRIATNSRGGGVIEPQILKQWFVAVNKPFPMPYSEIDGIMTGEEVTLKKLMRHTVDSGQIKITPERFEKTYYHWIDNLRDWCISRQLWFGHRIPVWYKKLSEPVHITYFVHGTTEDNETGKSSGHYDAKLSDLGKRQNLELKEQVKDKEFDAVFCSDLGRAVETAHTAFGGKAEIIQDARLRECDYGDFTRQDEHIVSPRKRASISIPFPGGESYRDIERRMGSFLSDISEKYQGKRVAIVSHMGPQLALDVLIKKKTWEQAFNEDWRNTHSYRPGWDYELAELTYVDTEPPASEGWQQDPDTLDTWFSSGLWTISPFGWPPRRMWDLKIYGNDIFTALQNSTKHIETRAGKPAGSEKYWGDFKKGDLIRFHLAERETDTEIDGVKSVMKAVKAVRHFKTLDEMRDVYPASADYPGKSAEDIAAWWKTQPALWERIEKYGIWAIELADPDLAVYHPTTFMNPGYEILFFWVARMILMSGVLVGQIPFKTVYLHGIVRDKDGRKFSKSLGNGIDPLELADKYGADAVRMALIVGAAPGNDVKFSESKVAGYRNFATKIWNASRFVLMNKPFGDAGPTELTASRGEPADERGPNADQTLLRSDGASAVAVKALADKSDGQAQTDTDDMRMQLLNDRQRKYLEEFSNVKKEIAEHIEKFELHLAAEKGYHYFWHTFADVVIEAEKDFLKNGIEEEKRASYFTLKTILIGCLAMLHPFIPFVTEEIYHKFYPGQMLMVRKW